MEFFPTQSHKHPQNKQHNNNSNKKRLTQDQVRLLERSFTTNKKLEPELKLHLANQLGVPPRQVAIWYQNKRARWKTQSLELDYNTLQVKLESVMAEKRRLERDVKHLKEELRRAQEMLQLACNSSSNIQRISSSTSTSEANFGNSSENGGGSSGLHGYNNNVQHDKDQDVMPLDELYACLIDANFRSSIWG